MKKSDRVKALRAKRARRSGPLNGLIPITLLPKELTCTIPTDRDLRAYKQLHAQRSQLDGFIRKCPIILG